MKNKLKIAVCAIFVVIFSLLPMSVFAKTDNVSASDLIRIAKDSNPDMYSIDTSHSTAIFEDDNNYYLVVVSRVVTYRCGSYGTVFECVRPGTNSFDFQKYTFPKLNCYDVTFDTVHCNSVVGRYFEFGYPTKFIYANQNVYGKWQAESTDTSVIFFQQMNSIPKGTTKRVPLNTTLSSIQLTGILDEVIALLPILFPVLIAFLAIRKGIAFCLATLRAS